MEQTDYLQAVSTALCLIRDGCPSKRRLAEKLDLSPIAMADLVEQMEQDGYIFSWPGRDLVVITSAGRRAVSHIELVNYEGQTRIYTRRAAAGPDGRARVA